MPYQKKQDISYSFMLDLLKNETALTIFKGPGDAPFLPIKKL